mmetsp:Transcript_21828/g.54100  ORF Transcript_21828/g.54100 Transcript_21828/m.54100 type:complete len:229 (+) Transcript_21828:302-988(+)
MAFVSYRHVLNIFSFCTIERLPVSFSTWKLPCEKSKHRLQLQAMDSFVLSLLSLVLIHFPIHDGKDTQQLVFLFHSQICPDSKGQTPPLRHGKLKGVLDVDIPSVADLHHVLVRIPIVQISHVQRVDRLDQRKGLFARHQIAQSIVQIDGNGDPPHAQDVRQVTNGDGIIPGNFAQGGISQKANFSRRRGFAFFLSAHGGNQFFLFFRIRRRSFLLVWCFLLWILCFI